MGNTASGDVISFEEQIKPLFRESDRESMEFVFDLWSRDEVTERTAPPFSSASVTARCPAMDLGRTSRSASSNLGSTRECPRDRRLLRALARSSLVTFPSPASRGCAKQQTSCDVGKLIDYPWKGQLASELNRRSENPPVLAVPLLRGLRAC